MAFGVALLLGCTAAFLAWTEVRIRYVVNLTIASVLLLAFVTLRGLIRHARTVE